MCGFMEEYALKNNLEELFKQIFVISTYCQRKEIMTKSHIMYNFQWSETDVWGFLPNVTESFCVCC